MILYQFEGNNRISKRHMNECYIALWTGFISPYERVLYRLMNGCYIALWTGVISPYERVLYRLKRTEFVGTIQEYISNWLVLFTFVNKELRPW